MRITIVGLAQLQPQFRAWLKNINEINTLPVPAEPAAAEIETDILLLYGRPTAITFGLPRNVRFFEPQLVRDICTYVVPRLDLERWWEIDMNRARAERFFWGLRAAKEQANLEGLKHAIRERAVNHVL